MPNFIVQWEKDPRYRHHYLCGRHPSNVILNQSLASQGSSLYDGDIPHRDGTILGYLNWLFSVVRCDVKIDRLQEALDRL